MTWSCVGLVVGVAGATIALVPSLDLGDTSVISPTASHDSFFFVAGAEWLQDHPILETPEVGSRPGTGNALPAEGPAVGSVDYHLRWGLELALAGLSSLTGTDPSDTFTPGLAIWPLLLPGVCISGVALLRRRRVAGAAAGLMISCSAIVIHQVYNQNAASLLGIALVLLLLPVMMACIEGTAPLWFGALILGAVVGSYTEVAPLVAPAVLAAAVVSRHPRASTTAIQSRSTHRQAGPGGRWLGSRLGRSVTVVAISVVLVPVAWFRGLQQVLANTQSGYDVFRYPFQDSDWSVVTARVLGFESLTSTTSMNPAALALAALLVAGAVMAIVLRGSRGLWLGSLAAILTLVTYLTAANRGYTQERAIDVFLPIVIFASVLGWDKAVSRMPGRVGTTVAAALVVPLMLWVVGNGRTARAEADLTSPSRHVDGDFAEAAGWVDELGGDHGDNTAVVVPTFFDQLWIADALRDQRLVAYPSMNPSYLIGTSYWDGLPDRYVLVGHGALVDASPGTIIRSNARFDLLDTAKGPVTVAAPRRAQFWEPFPDGAGSLIAYARTTELLVLGTRGTSKILVEISSRTPQIDVDLSIGTGLSTRVRGAMRQRVTVRVVDPDADSQIIRIVNHRFDPTDPGATAVVVSQVGRR